MIFSVDVKMSLRAKFSDALVNPTCDQLIKC